MSLTIPPHAGGRALSVGHKFLLRQGNRRGPTRDFFWRDPAPTEKAAAKRKTRAVKAEM